MPENLERRVAILGDSKRQVYTPYDERDDTPPKRLIAYMACRRPRLSCKLNHPCITSSTVCLTSLVEFDGSDVRPDRWPKDMERASANDQAGLLNMDYFRITIFVLKRVRTLRYDGNGW